MQGTLQSPVKMAMLSYESKQFNFCDGEIMEQQPSKRTDQSAPTEAAQPSTGPEAQTGGTGGRLSRRRFTRAGVAAPIILTLANRPAFGAICTVSGFASFSPNNPSGVRHKVDGCGGYSPVGWKNPDAGNGDGSREDWIAAGYFANPRPNTNDPGGTLFVDVFGGTTSGFGTLHDVLKNKSGSLEFHAVAALLNAGFMPTYGLSKADVIGLYWLGATGTGSYTTASGTVINAKDINVKAFFEQTYH